METLTPWVHLPTLSRVYAGDAAAPAKLPTASLPLQLGHHMVLSSSHPFFARGPTHASSYHSAVGMPAHCFASMFTDWLCFSSLTPLSSSLEDSLLGEGPVERPGTRLCLSDGPLRTAVKRRYGKRLGLEKAAHILVAGDCSLSHGCEARTCRSGVQWPLGR